MNLPLRTFILIGRVGEVKHSVLLHGSGCHHGIHQGVVEVNGLDGQSLSAVQTANYDAAAAVVVVLVSHVDDNAAILHFERLGGAQKEEEGGRKNSGKAEFNIDLVQHNAFFLRMFFLIKTEKMLPASKREHLK